MPEALRRTVGELARRLEGKVTGGRRAIRDCGSAGASGGYLEIGETFSVAGRHAGRPASVEFRRSGDLEIDLAIEGDVRMRIQRNTFLARLTSLFGRRLHSGEERFDDELLVVEEGGKPLREVVSRPEFRDAVTALVPFQVVVGKGRILEAIFTYDRDRVRVEEVMDLLDRLQALARILEA